MIYLYKYCIIDIIYNFNILQDNMLLKEALNIQKESKWQIDILELAWIKIKYDYCEEKYYKNKVSKLPKWNYFISDLDWTFYRWVLIKEAFSSFAKYLTEQDIRNIDLERYKEFLDDFKFFKELEKDAYNKKIDYTEYLNAGMYILYKYHNLVSWDKYIVYLKEKFYIDEKVNPLRFSMRKIKEILLAWDNFIFISWASSFVFEIYIELLKEHIRKDLWVWYVKNIYWISSYVNFNKKFVYNMWNKDWKYRFISEMKKKWIFKKIIWWMWDTTSDYWISNHLDNNINFYFINPANTVLTDYEKLYKKWVNYKFIFERKDLIFEYKKENIKIL